MSWHAAVDFRKSGPQAGAQAPWQDYGKILKFDSDVMVGVAADGAERGPFSHIAARLAVQTAADTIRAEAGRYEATAQRPAEAEIQSLFTDLIETVRDRLAAAARENGTAPEDLATMLFVVLASPGGLAAMRIGDGFVVYRQSGRRYECLFDEGDTEGRPEAIRFVAADTPPEAITVSVREGPMEFLCASTDALEPLSIRPADRRPHTPFFRPLDQCATLAKDDIDVHRGIRAFLRAQETNGLLAADCMLMLGGYRGAPCYPSAAHRA